MNVDLTNILTQRFLWPTFTEDASNYHVMLIAVIVGIKRREHLPIWSTYTFEKSQLCWTYLTPDDTPI